MKYVKIVLVSILAMTGSVAGGKTGTTEVSVKMSAYNSLASQTDSTPFITATGTRTKVGVVAVSRDLLKRFGYGAKVRVVRWLPSRGCNQKALPNISFFVVEDTMHARKVNQVDVWMPTRSQALTFGTCRAVVAFSY